MVRRRVGLRLGSLHQEDHRMHIASIGIDLGKTTFHLVALGNATRFCCVRSSRARNCWPTPRTCLASLIGMEACSGAHFLGCRTARTRARGAADSRAVCEALPQVEQERLHRCGSDRRSRDRAEHAFRADQDARSNSTAGHASGAGSTGASAHRTDQPDSRIPAGTRSSPSRPSPSTCARTCRL